MACHSSTLAWRIPGTGEPGGLPYMGSHRDGHDCSDSSSFKILILPPSDIYPRGIIYPSGIAGSSGSSFLIF